MNPLYYVHIMNVYNRHIMINLKYLDIVTM